MDSKKEQLLREYWEANIRVMGLLLSIWAIVSLGCGILLADVLNAWNFPGTAIPLGFWFAQQGSIATFVVLVLVYAIVMNRLEVTHHRKLEAAEKEVNNGR